MILVGRSSILSNQMSLWSDFFDCSSENVSHICDKFERLCSNFDHLCNILRFSGKKKPVIEVHSFTGSLIKAKTL
ncbi:hypothetical protein DFP77_10862 [Marinomonas foliarum]|uniref:Uncharacterized protein n=1 Tax=Marinomonas foliarum TaxID=491950 RepID=A0A369ABR6_9GAMM|nr:hypothetical protein DFP77_10862 [Marinomonas foliarum]